MISLAQIEAITATLKKIQALNLDKLTQSVKQAVEHPSVTSVIDAAANGLADASAIAALVPGGVVISADLGLAATLFSLLDEAVKSIELAPDFGKRLSAVGIHIPALIETKHTQPPVDGVNPETGAPLFT